MASIKRFFAPTEDAAAKRKRLGEPEPELKDPEVCRKSSPVPPSPYAVLRETRRYPSGSLHLPLSSSLSPLTPQTFMSWNCCKFIDRLEKDKLALHSFIRERDPDVIALQEVWFAAVADLRLRDELRTTSKEDRNELSALTRALSVPPLRNYNVFWSLNDGRSSGTGLLVKKTLVPPLMRYTLAAPSPGGPVGGPHQEEGRVQVAEFPRLIVVNTYAQNNGFFVGDDGEDGEAGGVGQGPQAAKRRVWDSDLKAFFVRAATTGPATKPIVWMGDMNACRCLNADERGAVASNLSWLRAPPLALIFLSSLAPFAPARSWT